MNWELERNFVDPNSSTGDKFGVGVTGSMSTSLNHSVGGIILAGGGSICASNISEDSMGTCASSSSASSGGWKRRYCGSRNFVFLGSSMVIGVRLQVTVNPFAQCVQELYIFHNYLTRGRKDYI